jgi:hypothetical protein
MVTNTVSLRITLTQSVGMLLTLLTYIGQTIRFTGMGALVKKADVLVMPITQREYQG